MGIDEAIEARRGELVLERALRNQKLMECLASDTKKALELREKRRQLLGLASRVAVSLTAAKIPADIELVTKTVAYKRKPWSVHGIVTDQQISPVASGWLLRKNSTERGITTLLQDLPFVLNGSKGAVLSPDGKIKTIEIPTCDTVPSVFVGSTGVVIIRSAFQRFPSLVDSHHQSEPTQLGANVRDYHEGKIGLYANLDNDPSAFCPTSFWEGEDRYYEQEGRNYSALTGGLITLAALNNVSV